MAIRFAQGGFTTVPVLMPAATGLPADVSSPQAGPPAPGASGVPCCETSPGPWRSGCLRRKS